jgi:hypothetical protein
MLLNLDIEAKGNSVTLFYGFETVFYGKKGFYTEGASF